MILKIRDLPTIGGIREYILPKLFFKSSSFKSMIKFHNETGRRPTYTAWNGKKLPVTEPPLLMKKTRDELLSYVDTPFSSDYPSHTQRVETGVKLTTAGAARVVGQKRQVGECFMVEASRKKSFVTTRHLSNPHNDDFTVNCNYLNVVSEDQCRFSKTQ